MKDIEIEGKPMALLLDTGATRSSLFKSTVAGLNQKVVYDGGINIHGITDIGKGDRIVIPEMRMGKLDFQNQVMVVLEDREITDNQPVNDIKYDGLIGMDVLKDYHLLISKQNKTLSLIPRSLSVSIPASWLRTSLYPNPYIEDERHLHFLPLSFSNQTIPALFDTGADINIMNWNEARYPALKETRKKLLEDWEFQGAIGLFQPKAKTQIINLLSEQISWRRKDFIIMELDNLAVLGVGESPFAVAGIKLFDQDEVFVNFDADILAVKPKRDFRRVRSVQSPTNDIPFDR